MGIAKLYSQSGGSSFKPNGIIQDYYVYAGERIEEGDFVELLTGSNGAETETQVRKATTSDIYGVAKTKGMGAYKTVEYTIPEGESVRQGESKEIGVETIVEGDIIPKEWTMTNYDVASNGNIIIKTNSTNLTSKNNVSSPCGGSGQLIFMTSDNEENWWQIDFGKKEKIIEIYVSISLAVNSATFHIQGSNDEQNWEDLLVKPDGTETISETLTNTGWYRYYRLVFKTLAIGYSVRIYNVYTTKYIEKVNKTGTALQSGTAGDTIQIAVPVTDEESTGHKDMIRVYQPYSENQFVMADGNILTTSNGDVFLLKEAI